MQIETHELKNKIVKTQGLEKYLTLNIISSSFFFGYTSFFLIFNFFFGRYGSPILLECIMIHACLL